MKIHCCNFGSLQPPISFSKPIICCLGLIVQTDHRVIVIDSGFGAKDIETPFQRLGPALHLLNPLLLVQETVTSHLKKLGLQNSDVTDIIFTHLDMDHVGGLSDFPKSIAHCLDIEFRAAFSANLKNPRYRKSQFQSHQRWKTYTPLKAKFYNFEESVPLEFDGIQIHLVPLPGHSAGHCGVAIEKEGKILFHAGDGIYTRNQLNSFKLKDLPLTSFEFLVAHDKKKMIRTISKIRELKNENSVKIICSHDSRFLNVKF